MTDPVPDRRFAPLASADVDRAFREADRLLDVHGLDVRGDAPALELFAGAGARIEGQRVRFPAGLAMELVQRSAPLSFQQLARNRRRTVRFGGGARIFAPASGPPFVQEAGGPRRYATLDDFHRVARMVQASAALEHAGGGYCEPSDRPERSRHLDMLHALFTLTDKPVKGCMRSPGQVEDSLAMARIVFGDATVQRECCLINLFNIESPLVLAGPIAEGIRRTAAAGQASLISSYAMMGMTGPVTLPGALALMLAEVQAVAALTQLVRPGAPVMCGLYAVPFSMQIMRPVFGAVEAHLVMTAGAQLIRRLGVPFRGDGAVTSAKCVDAQAGRDTAWGVQTVLAAGVDFALHSAGWLDSGLVLSYEKFAHDVAVIASAHASRVDLEAADHPDEFPATASDHPRDSTALLKEWSDPGIDSAIERDLHEFVAERSRRYALDDAR